MGDPETENVGSGIFDFFSRVPKIFNFRKKLIFFRKSTILGTVSAPKNQKFHLQRFLSQDLP